MADAVRLISISRGYDPRDFALVAFGGAGALHGVAIARELSIPAVIVPPNPGVTSALGCLLVDVQHDFSESYLAGTAEADPAAIEAAFARLEKEALRAAAHEGVAAIRHRPAAHHRHDVPGPMALAGGCRAEPDRLASTDLVEAFHRSHEREYNFRRDDAPVDLFRLNLKAVGVVPKAELADSRGDRRHARRPRAGARSGSKPIRCIETPVYERTDLPAGRQARRSRRGRTARFHRP